MCVWCVLVSVLCVCIYLCGCVFCVCLFVFCVRVKMCTFGCVCVVASVLGYVCGCYCVGCLCGCGCGICVFGC